jgi:hypothetical protein
LNRRIIIIFITIDYVAKLDAGLMSNRLRLGLSGSYRFIPGLCFSLLSSSIENLKSLTIFAPFSVATLRMSPNFIKIP